MSVREFQKAITYLREVQEVALFATMADSRWYAAFGASPFFFIMLPFIGLLLTLNAVTNAYRLAKAHNKNLEQTLNLATSVICAVLASVSLYGGALSAFMGFSFAAGPWFFFSSLLVASFHQLITLGINLYSLWESPEGSAQRKHYLQAALNNLFILGLLSAALGAVIFVMLLPGVAPVVGIASAIAAVTFTVVDIFWRMVPHPYKLSIKKFLALGKPEGVFPEQLTAENKSALNFKTDNVLEEKIPPHHCLFACVDYSAQISTMSLEQAQSYLEQALSKKMERFPQNAVYDRKTADKIALLNELITTLDNPRELSKKDVVIKHPLAFQSFFTEKGEVEQLFDAVSQFQRRRQLLDTAALKNALN